MSEAAIRFLHCLRLASNFTTPVTLAMVETIDFSHIQTLYVEDLDVSSDAGVRVICTKLWPLMELHLVRCKLPKDMSRLQLPHLHTLQVCAWGNKKHFTQSQLIGMPALRTFNLYL